MTGLVLFYHRTKTLCLVEGMQHVQLLVFVPWDSGVACTFSNDTSANNSASCKHCPKKFEHARNLTRLKSSQCHCKVWKSKSIPLQHKRKLCWEAFQAIINHSAEVCSFSLCGSPAIFLWSFTKSFLVHASSTTRNSKNLTRKLFVPQTDLDWGGAGRELLFGLCDTNAVTRDHHCLVCMWYKGELMSGTMLALFGFWAPSKCETCFTVGASRAASHTSELLVRRLWVNLIRDATRDASSVRWTSSSLHKLRG